MAFSQGLVSGTDIPVEHLDYDYIGKCSSPSELEKLLKILRSNKEGYYPKLIKFTEDHLAKLNPNSKLLVKTEPAKQLRDMPNKDGLMADLEEWQEQVSGEEASLQSTPHPDQPPLLNGDEEELPPIRKAGNIAAGKTEREAESKAEGKSSSQRIKSADYKSWDKLDVEKECGKVDQQPPGQDHSQNGDHTPNCVPAKLSESELSMSAAEKKRAAVREKDKGNEAFRAGDYEEAISYYSRSILLEGSVPSYNNRAMALIKLHRYKEALQDCAKVLQLEPTNTKALLRRGTALVSLKEWKEVESAMETLLKLEPKNKKAQEMLTQARKELGQAKKKGRRVQIEEVEEEERNDGPTPKVTNAGMPPQAPPPAEVVVATAPMPEEVKQLKEKGNELFRRGQYAEALEVYSKAVNRLRKAGDGHEVSLSTILNNRAACHLKNGNSPACVEDCTNSLQLVPINLKALMRRATAYEYMDKYRLAFVDNQMALTLDRSLDTVYAANNRLRKLLEEQDGYQWKDKLPQHPQHDSIMQALRQQATFASTSTASSTSETTDTTDTANTTEGATSITTSTASTTDTSDTTDASEGAATPPSITTSTAANTTTTSVTQVATPISTAAPSSPPATPTPPPSNSEQFETAKAQGNEHVKKGRYLEALNCYSLCIDACPERVVGYTNRALCHLKLSSPGSAEQDCSKALELDSANIKALYRRAMARKALEKYGDSMKDLKQLLSMDEENSAAKGEYADVKRLWEKQLRKMQQKRGGGGGSGGGGGGKPASSNKKKQPSQQQQRAKTQTSASVAAKAREMSQQQRELEQLLEETKSKVKQLKENPMAFPDPAATSEYSSYLNPGKTTYYKNQQSQAQAKSSSTKPPSTKPSSAKSSSVKPQSASSQPASRSAQQATAQGKAQPSSRRRKVVVEEEKEEVEGAEVEGREKQAQQQQTPQVQEQSSPPIQEGKQSAQVQGGGAQQPLAQAQEGGAQQPSAQVQEGKESVESGSAKVQQSTESEVEKQPAQEKLSTESEGEKQPVEVKKGGEGTSSRASKPSDDDELSSHYQFVQRWNSIARGGSYEECADLLQKIPPERLPEIITNQLDGAMLSSIVKAISRQFLPNKHFKLSLDVLENLSKVPRFQTIAMFLDKQEVTELGTVFAAMEEDMDRATIQNLKKLYGVKT